MKEFESLKQVETERVKQVLLGWYGHVVRVKDRTYGQTIQESSIKGVITRGKKKKGRWMMQLKL